MAIPDFQTMMLPLLKFAGDNQEHSSSEVIDFLAMQFGLTEEDKREVTSSGNIKYDNRIGWVLTHLRKARLLESTGRGKFRITQQGLGVLKNNPASINMKFLKQFPGYSEFARLKDLSTHETNGKQSEEVVEAIQTQPPDEILDSLYQSLRRELAQELLDRIKSCSPRFFERLVVDLLVSMGYGGSRKDAGQALGQSGDGGIDGIIKEDKLGLDVIYLQAKRWESTVGRPVVQAFAGSLEGHRARKGVLITTSQFSNDAKDYVTRIEKKIVLIDGQQLAQLMIDHGLGVAEKATYTIKKIDGDYFSEEL